MVSPAVIIVVQSGLFVAMGYVHLLKFAQLVRYPVTFQARQPAPRRIVAITVNAISIPASAIVARRTNPINAATAVAVVIRLIVEILITIQPPH